MVVKLISFCKRIYIKYYNTISLNKNLLLSGIVGFIISLIVAYFSAKYSTNIFTNSALTVIIGFVISKTVFVILFHMDYKKTYTKRLNGKINFPILKEIVKRMIVADSIFDIINNVSRFFVLAELSRIGFPPIQATAISSIIASILSYFAINLTVKRLHVFSSKKTKKLF